jgi:hypothetical protein
VEYAQKEIANLDGKEKEGVISHCDVSWYSNHPHRA